MNVLERLTRVSVIIPALCYTQNVDYLVRRIFDQDFVPNEIILVLPKSSAKPNDLINSSTVKVVYQDGVGPANARNVGACFASGDVLVFLDSDCMPNGNSWLGTLTSAFETDKSNIVSGRVIILGTSVVHRFVRALNGLGTPDYGLNDFSSINELQSFPSTNFAIRKSLFQKLNGFDNALMIAEDLDLCIRARRNGIPISYVAGAVVTHYHRSNIFSLIKHAFFTGQGSVSFIKKYGFWNRFLRGTVISVIFAISLFFFIAVSPIIYLTKLDFLYFLLPACVYFLLLMRLAKGCKLFADFLILPIILALYSLLIGLGVLFQIIYFYK